MLSSSETAEIIIRCVDLCMVPKLMNDIGWLIYFVRRLTSGKQFRVCLLCSGILL